MWAGYSLCWPPCSLRYAIPDAACFGQRMISGIEIGIQGVFWTAHEGQTPGKNLMGLKTVRKVSHNLMMDGLNEWHTYVVGR